MKTKKNNNLIKERLQVQAHTASKIGIKRSSLDLKNKNSERSSTVHCKDLRVHPN